MGSSERESGDVRLTVVSLPSTSSAPESSRKRQNIESVWGFAKRFVRSTRNRLSLQGAVASLALSERSVRSRSRRDPSPPAHQLVAPALLAVFEKLPTSERIRLRQVSRLTNFLSLSIPFSLPPLKLYSNRGAFYLVTECPDLVVHYLLPDVPLTRLAEDNGTLAFTRAQAEFLLRRIGTRVDHVEHLWLETDFNGSLCSSLLDSLFPESHNRSVARKRKMTMEKLTIVECKMYDINQASTMLAYFCNSLVQLRLRRVQMESSALSKQLWSRIAQCRLLKQFQYETCCFDKYSHEFIVGALCDKQIVSLELGGLHSFSACQLGKVTEQHCVKHLAVMSTRIDPSSYLHGCMIGTVQQLDSLLIECGITFSIDDFDDRVIMEKLLNQMKKSGNLEVVHHVLNRASDGARAMSYWLELSRDTDRSVHLMLAGISQVRIDQAVGRIVRKCDNVYKAPSKGKYLTLTRGVGRIRILDQYTWFGENDGD